MMERLPLIASVAAALVLGWLLGAGLIGFVIFVLSALAGTHLAASRPPGSEQIYWLFVAITLALFVINLTGLISINRVLMIAPLIVAVCYFVARAAQRVAGQRGNLPSA